MAGKALPVLIARSPATLEKKLKAIEQKTRKQIQESEEALTCLRDFSGDLLDPKISHEDKQEIIEFIRNDMGKTITETDQSALQEHMADVEFFLRMQSATLSILPKLKIEPLAELKNIDSELSTIDVIGHGEPNSGFIYSGQSADSLRISTDELALMLRKNGLKPEHRNFKLPQCDSAEIATRSAFSETVPCQVQGNKASAIYRLARSLNSQAFLEASVKGYQGLAMAHVRPENGSNHLRSIGDKIVLAKDYSVTIDTKKSPPSMDDSTSSNET
jgi:hypothetical protein